MRIVFFGIPDMGVICLNALAEKYLEDIVAVVPPIPTHQAHNFMVQVAEHYNLPCVHFVKKPDEAYFVRKLKDLNPDIGIVCSFNHLIPQEVIDIFPMGIINCHPSLLPDYRGGNPYFYQIINDETQTGVTFHYMDSTFDTGDIIYQIPIPMDNLDTFGTLFEITNEYTALYLAEIVKRLKNNEPLPRIPQQKSDDFKKAPSVKVERGDTLVDWNKSADYIERFTRACNPFFGAACTFQYKTMKFWTGEFDLNKNYTAPVGTVVEVTEDRLGIQTGKGVYYPTCLSFGFLMNCNIKEFVKKFKPQIGEVFVGKL